MTALPERPRNARRVQNFLVVWLDATIDEVNNQDSRKTISKLNQIVQDVNTFTDVDECVAFIRTIKEEKAFLISSGAFGPTIVPAVHDMSQVSTIYIFCGNKARHEQWAKEWPKVGGVFTDIKPICEALKHSMQAVDQNSIAISFVAPAAGVTSQNIGQLDSSFMYTEILTEILLTIDFDQSHIHDFVETARQLFAGDARELKNVDKLEREYYEHSPIWWYTYESFLYFTLNRASRLMEVDMLISMGFFVRDLHKHIATLHEEQFGKHGSSSIFTVYRGQGLSQTAFSQMAKMKGGLLSFNNFLSTSTDRVVSLCYARQGMETSDSVGVIFVLKIDPSVPSTPFADVSDVSYFPGEPEVLFSMHSIFRIGDIKQIDGNNRLWEISLTMTNDNDPQLRILTDHIRGENKGASGWHRLGDLMIKLNKFDQAKRLFEDLLKQATSDREKALLYYQLGSIMDGQGKYADALTFYEKSTKIREKILAPADPDLAKSYSSMGWMSENIGDYPKALSYYGKALWIQEKSLPSNHPDIAKSFGAIGSMSKNIGDYEKALSFYKKSLAIQQQSLPPNHPNLASTYNDLGEVYNGLNNCSTAVEYYERAVVTGEHSLPPNHPDLERYRKNLQDIKKKL